MSRRDCKASTLALFRKYEAAFWTLTMETARIKEKTRLGHLIVIQVSSSEIGCILNELWLSIIHLSLALFRFLIIQFFFQADGWAGHYFALGGPLKGKKFFGEYPSDLTSDSPLNTGRGRMIPTLSWESMLSPIMEWMGARLDDIPAYILPNFNQVGTPLIWSSEMFRSDEEL